PLLDIN
ncbi:DNA-directed RNA polymerase 7 kDa subunit, partial [Monkeypox virus]